MLSKRKTTQITVIKINPPAQEVSNPTTQADDNRVLNINNDYKISSPPERAWKTIKQHIEI